MPQTDQDKLRNYYALLKRAHADIEKHVQDASEKLEGASGFESLELAANAGDALRRLETNAEISDGQVFGLEAIIDEDLRPAIYVVDGKFSVSHPLWSKLSSDDQLRTRIENVIPSVGRIGLPGNRRYPYAGTGFVVGPGLLMTNRHVAEIFTRGLGNRTLEFLPNAKADVDFLREQGGPENSKTLEVSHTVMIHPYWDMAILRVEGLDASHPALQLSVEDARQLPDGHEIFVIGYPAFDPRNSADAQQKVFDGTYGIKRLQPGALHGAVTAASFGKKVAAAAHDCSTLGGNSGSAVFDLSNGKVLGLHFGGQYHEKNYAVPSSELARDSRVVDAGVAFAGSPPGGSGDWADWWSRADQTESAGRASSGSSASSGARAARNTVDVASTRSTKLQPSSDGLVRIELPLVITVSLGQQIANAASEAQLSTEAARNDFTEALKEPFKDSAYDDRRGYDSGFLNDRASDAIPLDVPSPRAVDPAVLARTKTGAQVLHYEHFSIAMHAKRRIALFTASNVVSTLELKKPEAGRDYTRRGLSGLGPNDQEKWFPDPRLEADLQLPDVFYNKDRSAFDKGHIVRRDDVAWGMTYDEVRRANGDTYHVTNCSPQVKEFNRSALGTANWGDLENHVLSEAASERLCVFAGPVLSDDDRIFRGMGDGSSELRARIPGRFWKVVAARTLEGCASFGFLLEQDLSDVEWEFAVADELSPFMYPITEIAEVAGIVFPPIVVDNDQYATTRGGNVALRSGAFRKRIKR